MDQINTNASFNTARLYQNHQLQQKPDSTSPVQSSPQNREQQVESKDFSSMFDDNALLKLQGNLEAIAQMAEQSLKKIDG
ncbi:hypothetical protein [Pelagicoccus albus]|uniref:Uncharacterized protein n=1 Tax=Pelagicoccus albus TaxID=415222 RepID=A0A7X1E6R5_9BACT|nr:hypothetical protein [Pelagicoccus albus]MBC2604985.1 hypothetical protein [Pelagicoccus albus]